MTNGPDDPISALAAGAIQLHELMMAYVNAGFTRPEALQIIISLMAAHAGINRLLGGTEDT